MVAGSVGIHFNQTGLRQLGQDQERQLQWMCAVSVIEGPQVQGPVDAESALSLRVKTMILMTVSIEALEYECCRMRRLRAVMPKRFLAWKSSKSMRLKPFNPTRPGLETLKLRL